MKRIPIPIPPIREDKVPGAWCAGVNGMNGLRLITSALLVVLLAVLPFSLLNSDHWWNPKIRWLLQFKRSSPFADLIVKNGVVYTGDASLPFVDSFAVRSGRILGVGNYSDIKVLARYGTVELDLGGKIVVPGFIDSHVHMIFGGLQMVRVELRGVSKKDEFVKRVKEAATNSESGCWIMGAGWNNDLWGGELPMASWIDEATPMNPVWLSRMDGHMGLANSAALKAASITSFSEDPEGGVILRTSAGDPTGLLVGSAINLVLELIPGESVEERRNAFLRASKYALTKGVTTVVDFGRYFQGAPVESSWEDLSDVYQWADSSRKMVLRVCLFFPLETWPLLAEMTKKLGHAVSQWIYLGGVKAFADGSLGSSSALFYEPYMNEDQNCGLQVTDTEKLLNLTLASDKSGLQVAVHAIGDKANDLVLDVFGSVNSANDVRDRRFRIEHAQHLAPGTVDRFGQQGIIASVQPDHLLDDAYSAVKKLGRDRADKGSFLFRSLLESKTTLVLGSDWPFADIDPLGSIRTAMKRIPPGSDHAWIPSERLSLSEALNAYTISAAHAIFLEKDLGSILPGKLADFVVLSADSWNHIADGGLATVVSTYVAGAQAYP